MGHRHDVWFTEDAAEFLSRAGERLTGDPVTSTVVSTIAHRIRDHGRGDLPHCWFAVVTASDGAFAGIAMRTAPFAPYPVYLLAMPDAAAAALADALLARGEDVGGATGLRPATDVFAAALAEATARTVGGELHHRLFELGALVDPRPVPGRLRAVREDEAEQALAWMRQFFVDADEQAGRAAGHDGEAGAFGIEDVRRKLAEGVLWFWGDDADRPVHLTGANPRLRGQPDRAGLHTEGGARPRLGGRRRRRGLAAAAGARRPRHPVHRPGEPDLQRALPGARLRRGRRHRAGRHRLIPGEGGRGAA